MLDWLIIGGGIHGTHLSYALTRIYNVPRHRLRVLDPHEQPLAVWRQQTANTGMRYLRSPHAQNLDIDPWSISTFAKTRAGQPLADFIPTHNRPSLKLFQAHSDWLVKRHQLDKLRLAGRAQGLTRLSNGWRVETERGGLETRNLILAMGATEQPHYPQWAHGLRATGAPINHIFEQKFNPHQLKNWRQVAIIGGGITAAQTALTLAEQQPGGVTLIARHKLRVHDFDSDICWIKANCAQAFHRETDVNRRRAIIQQARHRGSIPPDVDKRLRQAVTDGHIHLLGGEIHQATCENSHIKLRVGDTTDLAADRVVLATGFNPQRPGGAWLERAIQTYGLPVANCDYPIVDQTLSWQRGLYVAGALAELEIGPTARNIIGARFAGERIGKAVQL